MLNKQQQIMKSKIGFMAMMVVVALSVQAQVVRKNELQLYGSVGAKILQPKSFAYAMNISPSFATTIGGGAIWQKGKVQLGGEFFFTNATRHVLDIAPLIRV
jgi:hypothetical protein